MDPPKPRGGGGRSGGKAAAPRGGHGVGVDAPLSHAPAPNPEPSPGGHRPLPAAGSRRAQRGSASQEETSDRRPDSPRDSPRTPRAHGHGRGSGQGWRTPALHPQAWAPSAPKGAPGGSQLPPVRPARPCPPPAAAPPGTASPCKYGGGPPSAPGPAGGSVERTAHPEARAGLRGAPRGRQRARGTASQVSGPGPAAPLASQGFRRGWVRRAAPAPGIPH